MNLPTRQMLMGMTLGALCATGLAAIGPGYVLEAFADEMPAGFNADKLVRFGDRDYEVAYADWVSTDPLSTATVKKIEAGKVSYVSITTTATGTYSTDALTSPHVLYPGIDVREANPTGNFFAFWSGGSWQGFASQRGNSFISISGPAR
ncbi:hypothetical protein [Devosia chinhatensis]|uniref:Uncharacterized protein n=1 Tax=Devosia chinhatensis TaxID=429727 RepID=A0A0F5FJU0_9HYPH|nr:hypothetical protein [Devosia chinhatensis]KKB08845.1 hypothetical protein VE26_01930 [Devosia chinhatensis]